MSRMFLACLMAVVLFATQAEAQHKRVAPSASSDARPSSNYTNPFHMSDSGFRPQMHVVPEHVRPHYIESQYIESQYPQYVRPVYPQYPQVQQVSTKRYLGVSYVQLSQGVLVRSVNYGSPAQRVGIEPGDVILSVDGVSVGGGVDLNSTTRYSDGFVTLYIVDVRTGGIVQRNVDLRY